MKAFLKYLFIGKVYHSVGINDLNYEDLAILGVEEEGRIGLFRSIKDTKHLSRKELIDRELMNLKDKGWLYGEMILLRENEFLMPGLIDTHIHAPQYVFTGTGYDLNLLDWLETYTFPRESEFKSKDYAKLSYTKVVKKTLSSGTTTACYYATIHRNSSIVLAETCQRLGQRAFVGKVNMDRNSPDYYIEGTKESVEETKKFVKHVTGMKTALITPCVTPRFVPSCTPELMQELGIIASTHNLPIQSHMSENVGEIQWVKDLHPELNSYAGVYDKYGLLNKNTIMAHCIHMTAEERELLLKNKVKLRMTAKVGIAHCPSSNFSLHSGVLNVRRLLDEGFIKIGLGTDCAGGYSPSIMDSMRHALIASKVIHINSHGETVEDPGAAAQFKALNFKQVFYLATLGGARVLGLEDKIGSFKVGKQFDAIVVDTSFSLDKPMLMDNSNAALGLDIFEHDDPMAIFEKFIYLGDDRQMAKIYVNGNRVV